MNLLMRLSSDYTFYILNNIYIFFVIIRIAAVDDDGSRYLIGDVFGQLILIVLPDTGDLYTHFLGKVRINLTLILGLIYHNWLLIHIYL